MVAVLESETLILAACVQFYPLKIKYLWHGICRHLIIIVIKIFAYTIGLALNLISSHKMESYYYWFQRAHGISKLHYRSLFYYGGTQFLNSWF